MHHCTYPLILDPISEICDSGATKCRLHSRPEASHPPEIQCPGPGSHRLRGCSKLGFASGTCLCKHVLQLVSTMDGQKSTPSYVLFAKLCSVRSGVNGLGLWGSSIDFVSED